MRRLSAIIFILLLAVTPSCKFFKKIGLFGRKDNNLAILRTQRDSIRVADSIRKVQEHLLAIENTKLDSIRLAEEVSLAGERKNKYHIIVGSFITPEYAKGLAESYRQQGYDTKILKMEGSNFELVSAESHESFRKAILRLRAFQDTVEFDAWMFIRK